MSTSSHPRMAGSRLLHALTVAQTLPDYREIPNLVRAADATIEHILRRHPRTRTAREWSDE
jgi:hypothetical protein